MTARWRCKMEPGIRFNFLNGRQTRRDPSCALPVLLPVAYC
ncbi:hypothetical protein NW842_06670 [Synechococcus sp. R55.4]